ncbi:hypothetical protein M514_17190 [Trichuris suis]|uniref:Uncharacterized protein n=1 Tax=Trichuris suis TaxID=68888 RepID=A0A085NMM2_9BILA|nr:hypothetical protein M514_17190 [Trichuris suis]
MLEFTQCADALSRKSETTFGIRADLQERLCSIGGQCVRALSYCKTRCSKTSILHALSYRRRCPYECLKVQCNKERCIT